MFRFVFSWRQEVIRSEIRKEINRKSVVKKKNSEKLGRKNYTDSLTNIRKKRRKVKGRKKINRK